MHLVICSSASHVRSFLRLSRLLPQLRFKLRCGRDLRPQLRRLMTGVVQLCQRSPQLLLQGVQLLLLCICCSRCLLLKARRLPLQLLNGL